MSTQLSQRPELSESVIDALLRGERQEAISLLQKEANLPREEARELIATYILLTPGLRMKDTQSHTPWGIMKWLILLQAIVVAIGYFLFYRDQW
ncbi:MAG: hypothetical protein NNA20_09540 [Nitrospira sp.]|nr:hypothetical protein [Nitrospira sp.]MCP9442825.1 hypothetical protein [Nitrospira sp.]